MNPGGNPDLRVHQATLYALDHRLAQACAYLDGTQATPSTIAGFDPTVVDAVAEMIYFFQRSSGELAQRAGSLRQRVAQVVTDVAAADRQLVVAR